MLEVTVGCRGGVFLIHCHVVPANDPDVRQMIELRDLLRADLRARQAYALGKQRITAGICDSLDYTHAKAALIRRLLVGWPAAGTSPAGPISPPARTGSD